MALPEFTNTPSAPPEDGEQCIGPFPSQWIEANSAACWSPFTLSPPPSPCVALATTTSPVAVATRLGSKALFIISNWLITAKASGLTHAWRVQGGGAYTDVRGNGKNWLLDAEGAGPGAGGALGPQGFYYSSPLPFSPCFL